MKQIKTDFNEMVVSVPPEILTETDWSFAIAEKLDNLIKRQGLLKKGFAEAFGCRPSEVTKWLSGQQNFTLRTLSRFSAFFNEPFIIVVKQ